MEEIKYKVTDYLKRYEGKTLNLADLRGLWISYSKNTPRVDLCPLADRPSERQYEDSFRSYLEKLTELGLINEIIPKRGRKK